MLLIRTDTSRELLCANIVPVSSVMKHGTVLLLLLNKDGLTSNFGVFPCYWYFTNVLKHICLTIYKVLGIGWFNDLIWNFDTKVLDHQRPSTEIDVKRVQLKVIHIHCIIECFYSTRMSRSSQRRQIKYSIERYREREIYRKNSFDRPMKN